MRVFSNRTLNEAAAKYPDARESLRAWLVEARRAKWEKWQDVQVRYRSADRVKDRIVFNIKGNTYRLIVAYDFDRQALYFKWFGPHAEYDKIDVATVRYIK